MAERYSRGATPPHTTCVETTSHAEMVDGTRSWVCGQDCPRPAGPDAQRDERIAAYRDRERRRAARALDRFMESSAGRVSSSMDVAGERFVEAVGDYVLSRLGEPSQQAAICREHLSMACGCSTVTSSGWRSSEQQKSHYGARLDAIERPDDYDGDGTENSDPCAGGRCPDPWAHAEGAHDL